MVKRTFGYLVLMISLTIGSLFAAQKREVLHNQQTFLSEKLRINVLLHVGFAARKKDLAQPLITSLQPESRRYRSWWQLAGELDALKSLVSQRAELDRLQRLFLAPRMRTSAETRERRSVGAQTQDALFSIERSAADCQEKSTQTDGLVESEAPAMRAFQDEFIQTDSVTTKAEEKSESAGEDLDALRGAVSRTLSIVQNPAGAQTEEAEACSRGVAAMQAQLMQIQHGVLVERFMSTIKLMGTRVYVISKILDSADQKIPENSAEVLASCKEFIGKLPDQKDKIIELKQLLNAFGEHQYDALADLAADPLKKFKVYATPQRRAVGSSDWFTQRAALKAFWGDFSCAIRSVAPALLTEITDTWHLSLPEGALGRSARSPSPVSEGDSAT